MKLIILASGGLGATCLRQILDSKSVDFIATDSKSEAVIQLARDFNIPYFKGNPREGRLVNALGERQFDLLLSINYLFLIEEDVIVKASTAINFHGSLLPKYRGRTPHVWAIINGEHTTGITAHKIDIGCDTGDVVNQVEINIQFDDTGATVLQKYHQSYPGLISSIIEDFESNRIIGSPQDESKATFFGKRTPEDGLICWDWHKERIRNWVRAQADPYPGAFTYSNGERTIIDKVKFSDVGFKDEMTNGLVLAIHPFVVVKTPNGAVELTTVRNEQDLRFEVGQILGK